MSATAYEEAQEALILMEDNDTLHFESGMFDFTQELSVEGKDGVVIRGEGVDNTIINFANQTAGAQGILATNMTNVLFADFTVLDPAGDGIRINDSQGVTIIRTNVVYSGDPSAENGAYGLYPVACSDVLVDDCYVRGASDAGIYVGQSEKIICRNNLVEECVAGLEIENCNDADVYDNVLRNNTGGLLIFDLPNLPIIPEGARSRAFNNTIENNNFMNFAPEGNIVGSVPPGTGVLLLSPRDVELFDNTITGNNIMSIGVIAYESLSTLDANLAHDDENYDPYVYNINIHDNTISRDDVYPEATNALADVIKLLAYPDPALIPEILWDGFSNPDVPDEDKRICIRNNGDARWSNLDVANFFTNIVENDEVHDCMITPLPEVVVNAPMLP